MPTDISFEENKYKIKSRVILGQTQVPGMIKFLLNKGIVKTEKTAHALLLSITGLFLLAAVYVFSVYVLGVSMGNVDKVADKEKIEQAKKRIEEIKKQRGVNTKNNQ